MSGRSPSRVARAQHIRELAGWMSDERTHHILIEMARELEAGGGDGAATPSGPVPRGMPRSLS